MNGAIYNLQTIEQRNRDLRTKYVSPLIKWYQTNITKEDKYKLGLMSYEEFQEWQIELAQEKELEEKQKLLEENDISEKDDETTPATNSTERKNHTFWENDDSDRSNLANDTYEEFLAKNNIDVSNRNSLDIDSLLSM